MKLSLKALATNRINGSVTAFKTYPVLNDVLANLTDSGYWFINDNGEKQFAYKFAVKDGFSDPKKQYSFELALQVDTLQETINSDVKAAITNACRSGGHIYDKFRSGMYSLGGHFGGLATTHKSIVGSEKDSFNVCDADGNVRVQIGKIKPAQSVKEDERDAAVVELDKHLPAYRRSDKGFNLVDSIAWLGKLNTAHASDCQKYEGILEDLMEAFDIRTIDGLKHFASNLKRSADIIDTVRKK
ncbi:hypothetical protein FDJ47_gp50 [Enterobacter phage Ec_L1]|uniref:Uncharacterized protein n=1 Tax=Enterobacter phage Ec_L1 TaxID=2070180 RepID=A0A2P0W9X5_9CAUD|nr:hypothetical protein FDJ47_gp50 [Enterobacter phage Ec_L1]AUV57164.1 hypothetical protein Ec50 [Enterobacter phage Ec_L1]